MPIFVFNTRLPDTTASIRLAALLPARQLGFRALYFGPDLDPSKWPDAAKADLLIFTKAFDASFVSLAEEAKKRCIPLISSFCDFHFEGDRGETNRTLASLSEAAVVQTVTMAEAVRERWGLEAKVIEEALEYPQLPVKEDIGSPLRVLWYGSQTNLRELYDGLKVLTPGQSFHLNIVTDLLLPKSFFDCISGTFRGEVFFDRWSIGTQFQKMHQADVIFIPSSSRPENVVKGHNRLTEAINAGRFPIVYPNPQYLELKEYAWCSEDYLGGLTFFLQNHEKAKQMIRAGQTYVSARFGLQAVSEKWAQLTHKLLES